MNSNWNRTRFKSARGSQLVEFALVVPILIFLFLAILEGATVVRIHQIINNAAREGARVGAVDWARSFVDQSSTRNVLGEAAVCKYLKENKGVFQSWDGSDCSGVFSVTVEPFTITTGATPIYATRAIVSYQYTFRYMPEVKVLNLTGRAQFENFYPEATP